MPSDSKPANDLVLRGTLGFLMVAVFVIGAVLIFGVLGVQPTLPSVPVRATLTPIGSATVPVVTATATPSPQGGTSIADATEAPTGSTTTVSVTAPTGPAPGAFGMFDTNQTGSLSSYARYIVAGWILVVTVMLEIFLVIVYATFFINNPAFSQLPLGLPLASVRVFLIIVVVSIILIFAVLPDQWGNNKAVVLLFGLLSTVVGFYFGSRTGADAPATGTVKLTLSSESKTQKVSAPSDLVGTLAASYKDVIGSSSTLIAILLDAAGNMVTNGQAIAVVDSEGKAYFDFKTALRTLTPGVSCLMHIVSPAAVICEERVMIQA